ncbi:CASP-like protein 1U2 [Hordeum vulgare]|nr:CASP-like protein 1U2 [Hordeum vulgare]
MHAYIHTNTAHGALGWPSGISVRRAGPDIERQRDVLDDGGEAEGDAGAEGQQPGPPHLRAERHARVDADHGAVRGARGRVEQRLRQHVDDEQDDPGDPAAPVVVITAGAAELQVDRGGFQHGRGDVGAHEVDEGAVVPVGDGLGRCAGDGAVAGRGHHDRRREGQDERGEAEQQAHRLGAVGLVRLAPSRHGRSARDGWMEFWCL